MSRGDNTRRARALKRAAELASEGVVSLALGLIEWTRVKSVTAGAASIPKAATDDNDTVQVLEPYGFASRPSGEGVALVFAPSGDEEGRVVLGVSSVSGRPSTDAGDVNIWTIGGHRIELDDDGGLTITSRDSAPITINAGAGASITLNVGGGQFVNGGGPAAQKLLKAQATETFIAGAAQGITSVDPNIEAAFTAFGAALAGLADAAQTAKMRGE